MRNRPWRAPRSPSRDYAVRGRAEHHNRAPTGKSHMPTLTCYPIGNADCSVIDNLQSGKTIVFDYANMRDSSDKADLRIDLASELSRKFKAEGRDEVDVLVFTHLDRDHIKGAHEFFHFDHAEVHQGGIKVKELWVPAAAIVESGLDDDSRIIRSEARHRLKQGTGIRVFSGPDVLNDWFRENGLTYESRKHLIVDAGTLVPGFTSNVDGLEIFAHSPFAHRLDNGATINRNTDAILVQMTFFVNGVTTKLLLGADAKYQDLSEIVDITREHAREDRLEWDIFHLPHHCSYTALGPPENKGEDKTEPVENVRWLIEDQSRTGAIVVSPSDPIPLLGDSVLPPHRQAANYYREVVAKKNGKFVVTMDHPSRSQPMPLVIEIDDTRARVIGLVPGAAYATVSQPAPRAGKG